MSDTKKLTEEEIKVFQDTSSTIKQVASQLGDLEISYLNVKEQLTNIEKRKEELISLYHSTLKQQREHTQSLVEKYGQGNLNTDTWEITPVSE